MSRYAMDANAKMSEPCRETKKHVKDRLKRTKLVLKDFISVSEYIDMDYKEKNNVIGSLYMDMHRAKQALKEYNDRNKK